MDIILHIGAHRSATTSFQHYLRGQRDTLADQGIGFWGPVRTRGGLLNGLFPGPGAARGRNLVRRAEGRVKMQAAQARANGVQHLLVSDENMIGSMVQCLRDRALYPAIGERMARLSAAFGDQVTRVIFSTRSQDLWWASVAAYTVERGHAMPDAAAFEQISQNRRTWRDVITDLACAVPGAEIAITPFEQFAGQPHAVLATATGKPAPAQGSVPWRNKAPDTRALQAVLAERGDNADALPVGADRFQPFTPTQAARLRENDADDLHWLVAGADGLATLTEDPTRTKTGSSLQPGVLTKGQGHDSRQTSLARPG